MGLFAAASAVHQPALWTPRTRPDVDLSMPSEAGPVHMPTPPEGRRQGAARHICVPPPPPPTLLARGGPPPPGLASAAARQSGGTCFPPPSGPCRRRRWPASAGCRHGGQKWVLPTRFCCLVRRLMPRNLPGSPPLRLPLRGSLRARARAHARAHAGCKRVPPSTRHLAVGPSWNVARV